MKTLLTTAYAINPYKGSEDAMGWNLIYQIARFHKVIAVTRENNRPHIERYMQENPDYLYDNLTMVYFDLKKRARFWKKGSRGALLYFYLWQKHLPAFIKKQNLHFDIVHNLNFHNDWTPSFLWKLEKPFVWGPVGHHPIIPTEYMRDYEWSYQIKEMCAAKVKSIFWKMSPSLKQSVKRASHVICMNSTVPKVLNLQTKSHSFTPSVATLDFGFEPENKNQKFTMISAGRLVPLKGFDMTIRAFARFLRNLPLQLRSRCELSIVGSGPALQNYERLSRDLGADQHIRFIAWMDRHALIEKFKEASVFVFPSHEGAGMVVAEALSVGLPVICLDNCGPGEFIDKECGIAVSYHDYDQTVLEIASGMKKLFDEPELLQQMRVQARKRFETHFQWDLRGEEFRKVYLNV
jgi:glycosyltransferase involved in cell wall biosynthesis